MKMLCVHVLTLGMMIVIVKSARGFADDYAQGVQLSLDITGAGAVPTAQRAVFLGWRALRQNAKQCGPRRCRELS